MMDIPKTIKGVATRRIGGDSFILVTCNNKLRRYMDEHYEPIPKIHNAWRLPDTTEKFSNLELSEYNSCVIVGKGPSLEYFEKIYFEDIVPTYGECPVFAINEAIVPVEAYLADKDILIYGIQMDASLGKIYTPDKATLLVSSKAAKFYKSDPIIIYSPYDLGCSYRSWTIQCVLEICRQCRIKNINLIGCDAMSTKDTRYANCLGITDRKNPDRFLLARKAIQDKFKPFNIENNYLLGNQTIVDVLHSRDE